MRRLAAAAVAIGLALTLQVVPAQADQNTDVVLVVDTSGSMSGPRISKAKPAVVEFVTKVPATVGIGLVTFNSKVRTESEVTGDRNAVVKAMTTIRVGGNTALFDAIARGLELLRGTNNRRIVVLSDGADNSSKASLKALLDTLRIASVPVDVIALQPTQKHLKTLQSIVGASGGRLLTANAIDDLLSAYATAAEAFEPSASPPAQEEEVILVDTTTDLRGPVALAVFFLASMLFLLVTTVGRVRKARAVHQMRRYVNEYSEVLQRRLSRTSRSELLIMLEEYLAQRFPKTAVALDDADIEMSMTRWYSIRILSAIAIFFLTLFIAQSLILALLLFVAGFFLVPRIILSTRISRLRLEFSEALPATFSVAASSLRAGLTFDQALDTAVAEGKDEMARQMRRVLNEVQIGSTLEAALMRAAERMESEDLKWAVSALEIQREVGGSLAKILDTSAATIRSRIELKREVRTLSAEGRLSGYVLAALPVLMFVYLALTRRDYAQVFWTELIGYLMLGIIAVSFVIGWFWVNRIVKIRV